MAAAIQIAPTIIRAHIGLKTDAHDALIELAIMAVEAEAALWGAALSPAEVVKRVGVVVLDYPEINRALRKEACNA